MSTPPRTTNVGCVPFLLLIFFAAFVATLGVRLALHILGL